MIKSTKFSHYIQLLLGYIEAKIMLDIIENQHKFILSNKI